MKKYILPIMVLLASCNSGNDKKQTEAPTNDIQAVQQVDNNPQAFFAGKGSTPASTIEIISNADGTFLVKYSVEGVAAELSMNKEPLVIEGKQNVATGQVKFSGSGGSMMIEPQNCEGGTHTCTLTVGERVIETCGKYAE
jgi:hypothetical protein